MTEIQSIIAAYRRAAEENVCAALATVVRVEGSAYRRPGARLLVREDGRTTGVVSGGCLEGDVRGLAARVMRTGKPTLVRYDTTTDEDVVWGLGLGCNGVVDVLIEPANERADHLVRFLEACSNSQERAACATTIRAEGVADVALGSRVFLFPDGMVKADAGAPEYATLTQIILDLRKAVRSAASFVALYEGGNLEVFIEAVEPPVALIIFGAGADAVPLVTLGQCLGWLVTVVDTHARERSQERFGDADAVVLCRPEDIGSRLTFTDSTAAVVMTHNYFHDRELLKVLLSRSLRYVGCLGPKHRTERLLSELPDVPDVLDMQRLGQLHAPAGIDIGAETSSEIALSITAEVLAVLRGRRGGSLRARQGAIHGHAPVVANGHAARSAGASLLTSVGCPAGA
jgi:xanthine/CO dehydrogenase XdhC/CoxF family maturation factor